MSCTECNMQTSFIYEDAIDDVHNANDLGSVNDVNVIDQITSRWKTILPSDEL